MSAIPRTTTELLHYVTIDGPFVLMVQAKAIGV